MRNILFEALAIDPSTNLPVAVRMASCLPTGLVSGLDAKEWKPCIIGGPEFSLSLSSDGDTSALDISYGSISFILESQELQNLDWSRLIFNSATASIWYGDVSGKTLSNYRRIWSGTLGRFTRPDAITGRVDLLGPEATLNVPLLASKYSGTGGINGTANLTGTLKPVAIGYCINVQAVQIDPVNLIYQVSDGFCPVNTVFENALTLGASKGDFGSFNGLKAATLAKGEWATCSGQGLFRLGAVPTGKITCDIGVNVTSGNAILSLLQRAGVVSGNIATASFADAGRNYSNYLTDQVTILDTIRTAALWNSHYLIADGAGKFWLAPHDSTKTATNLSSDRNSEPFVRPDGIVQQDGGERVWRVKVGHTRVFSPNQPSEISPAVAQLGADLSAAEAEAQAAQETADLAYAQANVAITRYNSITADGILDRAEKQILLRDVAQMIADKPKNVATGQGQGIDTSLYTGAYDAWIAYLGTIDPSYSDTSTDSNIDRTVFNAKLKAYEDQLINLLNAIANKAATTANYTSVAGRPTTLGQFDPNAANTLTTTTNTANTANATATAANTAVNTLKPIVDTTVYNLNAITANVVTLQQTVPPLATAMNAAANAVAANTAAQIVLTNVTAANAAVQSARSSATNAAAQAGQSVVLAQAAVTSAQTQANNALGWAQAAYANAITAAGASLNANTANSAAWVAVGNANSASTAAGTFATLANTYVGYVKANATSALQYQTTALSASDSANASAASANTAQGIAVQASNTAATSAGTASNAAIYANSNAASANSAAGNAKTYSDWAQANSAAALNYSKTALNASNTANDAAASAQSSSVLAANASLNVNVITSMLIPDRYDASGGQYFTDQLQGSPATVTDLPSNVTISFGPVRDLTVVANQNAQIATRGVIPQIDGRIYRLEVEYAIIANGGSTDRIVFGLRQLDGSYSDTVNTIAGADGPFTGNLKVTSALFSDVQYDSSINLIDADAVWLRPYIRVFGSTGSTGTTIRFRRLTLTDYTEVFNAGVSASAAFVSNQYASANASAAAQNASTASDQASFAQTNASQALSYSRTAQNASNTANSASASANSAQGLAAQASNNANAAAGQAQTSAVWAASNATAATTNATSAKSSADYATANSASARSFSNSALTASNSAQAASATANSAMGTALQASNNANTAAGQAQTFSGYANQNAVSTAANAGAAAQSALYAATNATQANSFATTAISASQSANSSATAAQTAQGIAVSSSNQLTYLVAQDMPDRFLGSAVGFYRPTNANQYTGDPSTRTMDQVGYSQISLDSPFGSAFLFPTTGTALLATQGVAPATAGRVYEITVEINLAQYAGTPINFAVWLDCLAGDYSAISNTARSVALPTYSTPFKMVWRVSDTAPTALGSGADQAFAGAAWASGTAYFRVMTGSVAGFSGSSVFNRRISVRDITSQYAGEGSASAAALSASYAFANSTASSQQAGAASQSSLTANTAAGYSSANAGISQTWAAAAQSNASGAAGSAAAAATSATVAASVSLGAINANPVFGSYANAGSVPDGWTVESTGVANSARVAGPNGIGYSYRLIAAAGVDAYTAIQTAAGSISLNGWYVIEADVTLNGGRLTGAGVLFRGLNADSSASFDYPLIFSSEPDVSGAVVGNGTVGNTYYWRKLVRVTQPAAVTKSNVYVMSHWTGLGSTANQANIIFRRVSVRPASSGEIEARAASLAIPTLSANVTTLQGATASIDGRTRAYWQTTVNAGANTTAFISAQTVNTAGNSSSTIGFGASELHIYNPIQNGWKKALSIQGGNAVFSGGLQAGAYIRLGSGQGWPVALQSQDYNVGDGEVVNFGVDLGKVPALSFAGNNLQPLASGETYQLYADNLTSTGFTARLKKSAPGNYGSYDLTTSTQPGGSNPTYIIDLGQNPEANDGNYSYTFSVSITQEATDFYQDTGTQ